MFDKCRTCLESQGTLIDLKCPERLDLITKWTSFTNFEWIEHEKLGLFMCETCTENLDFAYRFQKQCTESNKVYEDLLASLLRQERNCSVEQTLEAVKNENLLVEDDADEDRSFVEIVVVDGTGINREQPEDKDNMFSCEHCKQEYMTKRSLQIHIRNVHKAKEKFQCDFCSKTFNRKCHKTEHERVHTQEKPYICNVCGKRCSQFSSLHTHIKMHGERKEVCEVCQKSYARTADLKLHMRKHTGSRPFLCPVCGHAFIQSGHLRDHLVTHSDARPYECETCGKCFKARSHLSIHRRTHTANKKFKCTVCEYTCHQPYRLSQHMKTHGSDVIISATATKNHEKQHVCQICRKSFSGSAALKSHMNTIHDVV